MVFWHFNGQLRSLSAGRGKTLKFYISLHIDKPCICPNKIALQILGFGWAGIFRRYLVEPAAMWWPTNLVQVSLFRHVVLMFIDYSLFRQALAYLCDMEFLLQSAPREGQETQRRSNADSIFYMCNDLQLFILHSTWLSFPHAHIYFLAVLDFPPVCYCPTDRFRPSRTRSGCCGVRLVHYLCISRKPSGHARVRCSQCGNRFYFGYVCGYPYGILV